MQNSDSALTALVASDLPRVYAESNAGTTDVPVQINNFRYVSLSFHDDEMSSTPRNLVQEQIEGAAYALGKDAFDKLMALCIVANFPTHTVSTAANFTRDTLTAVRYQLQAAGSAIPRYGILDSAGMQFLDWLMKPMFAS